MEPGVEKHFQPSTLEVETGGSQVLGHPLLQVSLGPSWDISNPVLEPSRNKPVTESPEENAHNCGLQAGISEGIE